MPKTSNKRLIIIKSIKAFNEDYNLYFVVYYKQNSKEYYVECTDKLIGDILLHD